jgi:ATP-dependent DNA ligase
MTECLPPSCPRPHRPQGNAARSRAVIARTADPLEVRKATLRSLLAKAGLGLRYNEHLEGDPTVFAHACNMGLEGIVSKRKDSAYRSGRSPDWLKMKNPAASAVKREAEEDCGR